MEWNNFYEWFKKLYLLAVAPLLSTGPVVLFVDGHHSHLSLDIIHHAKSHGIHMFCFPPHLTHILQPLDVGVYGPVKTCWKTILKDHKLATLSQNVIKEDFPGKQQSSKSPQLKHNFIIGLIKILWDRSITPGNLKGGFRACGLYPFSREAIPNSKLATSIPFKAAASDTETDKETTAKEAYKLACKGCGKAVTPSNSLTPMKFHIVGYLTRYIEAQPKPRSRDNRRVKVSVYGEVLTSNEVVERLEKEEKEKTEKAMAKKREKAEKTAKRESQRKEKAAKKSRKKSKPADSEEVEEIGRLNPH